MIALLIAAVLGMQEPAPLSPEAQRLIAPVTQAIAAEEARQAALPPPDGVAEELERMARIDQHAREVLNTLDMSSLPESERQPAARAVWEAIGAVDRRNQARLLALVPEDGWFTADGERAASAAFLIVQHSNVDLWRRFVPVLEPLARGGRISRQDYALMYDRLQLAEGRPQRYGSQMTCRDGRWVVNTLEDPANVDARRAEMELGPLADYEALFANRPSCG